MFIPLGDDQTALRAAATLCGLESVEGEGHLFNYGHLSQDDVPPWMNRPDCPLGPTDSDLILRVNTEAAAKCSRAPHEVGVFWYRDCMYAIWDGCKDGFGLNAFIGQYGERLRAFYVTEALRLLCPRLGLAPVAGGATTDESLLLEYQDAMAQKKITVRVNPKGEVQVATAGFEGTACKDATKQLEMALGTVTDDKPTQEMYSPPEQTTTIGG